MFRKIAILASKQDVAGLNIKDSLIELFPFLKLDIAFDDNPVYALRDTINSFDVKLYTLNSDSINAENIDKRIDAELFVFITKHKSKSGIPSLCVHTQGNIGEALLGGKQRQICISPACYLKQAFKNLYALNTIHFDVVQEVTHHGPYIEKPSFFIEIGSTEKEWGNKEAGLIVANALMKTLKHVEPCISAIGIGGLHTTPNFKKIILNTNIGLGHCCAHYNLPDLDETMLEQMIDRTVPKPSLIILDWKGLKKEKVRIKEIAGESAQKHNLKLVKTKDF